MLKLLYDSRINDPKAVSAQIKAMAPHPQDMSIVLMTRMWDDPEKAEGMPCEDAVRRDDTRMYHLPGLWPHDLVDPATYDHRQPCDTVMLYHDGIDLCAETEHPYGTQHTVIRFMPVENYDKMWKHLGKTSKKAWYKVMRHTLPAHEAMPGIMSLARPCRLIPIKPND